MSYQQCPDCGAYHDGDGLCDCAFPPPTTIKPSKVAPQDREGHKPDHKPCVLCGDRGEIPQQEMGEGGRWHENGESDPCPNCTPADPPAQGADG